MKKATGAIEKETLIIFARQLALIFDSEVTIHEGLSLIKEKSNQKMLVSIIDEVLKDIEANDSLSEAFSKHEKAFSPFFVNMIEIGEKSGNLVNVLEQIANSYEKELETRDKVKSAVSYPIILSVLMLGVVILLVVQILPMFNDVLNSLGGSMPLITQVMMSISEFIGNNLYFIALLVAIITVCLIAYKKTEPGRFFFDRLAFFTPVQRQIIISVIATNFSRNLSILIRSGIDIKSSIKMIKPIINNRYFEKRLDLALELIESGESFDLVMESLRLYPWVLLKLFSIAQSTGHIDDVLEKAAVEMERETDRRLKQLTTVIEPLLIMILSVIVGVILLSVVLPVVRIMNAIG